MNYQPSDCYDATFNDEAIDKLEETISFTNLHQADRFLQDPRSLNDETSDSTANLALNNFDESKSEDFDSEMALINYWLDSTDVVSPDNPFDEEEMIRSFDELEAKNTTKDEENKNVDSPTETDCNENERPDSDATLEEIDIKSIPLSIQEGLMFIDKQLCENDRRRFKREGRRRTKKTGSPPMTLDISKLKTYKLKSNQSLWLRLALITDVENSLHPRYIHQYVLTYFSRPSTQLKDGSIRIRVTQMDIDKGLIELTDLSIIKILLTEYNFKLIPYSLLSSDNDQSDPYDYDQNKTQMQNAKLFREQFQLKASRIACQLIVEEDENFLPTHIACVGNKMIAQEYEPGVKKRTKRLKKKH